MNKSVYQIEKLTPSFVIIRDIGTTHKSVTNDAERVVKELILGYGKHRRIYYYDSCGDLDELVHDGEKFVDFRSGGPT